MDKRMLLIPLVIACLTAGYATGTSQSPQEFEVRQNEIALAYAMRSLYGKQENLSRFENMKPKEGEEVHANAIGSFAEAIGKVLDKPEGYDVAYFLALNDYEARTAYESSIPRIQGAAAQAQVELSIIQIEQNRKIIELLRRLTEDPEE